MQLWARSRGDVNYNPPSQNHELKTLIWYKKNHELPRLEMRHSKYVFLIYCTYAQGFLKKSLLLSQYIFFINFKYYEWKLKRCRTVSAAEAEEGSSWRVMRSIRLNYLFIIMGNIEFFLEKNITLFFFIIVFVNYQSLRESAAVI